MVGAAGLVAGSPVQVTGLLARRRWPDRRRRDLSRMRSLPPVALPTRSACSARARANGLQEANAGRDPSPALARTPPGRGRLIRTQIRTVGRAAEMSRRSPPGLARGNSVAPVSRIRRRGQCAGYGRREPSISPPNNCPRVTGDGAHGHIRLRQAAPIVDIAGDPKMSVSMTRRSARLHRHWRA